MDTQDRANERNDSQAAANLIRGKLSKLYGLEPDAKEEIKEVKALTSDHGKLSKHQHFMDRINKSGRSLEEIQTAWHEYYQALDETGKHEVWQEFYAEHEKRRGRQKTETIVEPTTAEPQPILPATQPEPEPAKPAAAASATFTADDYNDYRPPKPRISNLKEDLLNKVSQRANKSKRHSHTHSLLFGLGMGTLAIFILLFGFFNERFITPFITPSHTVGATSIIVDPTNSGAVSSEPKIIIPKINIEAPVVYDIKTTEEKAVQKGLERGVVHYAITPNPGEKGNAVIVGHSSSNILNSGKFKFAFLLLKSLDNGDTFIINKDKKRYVYKVFDKYVTSPDDLSVLDPPDKDHPAIVTLITCDPPGQSTNRLIIQAEQIFPSPDKNPKPAATPTTAAAPQELGGPAPTLWSRFTSWL